MSVLCVGDVVVLDVDDGGSVSTQGLTETDIAISSPEGGRVDNYESTFLVRPQQNYAAENRLLAELEKRQVSRGTAQAMPEFRQLFDSRLNEQRINAGEFAQKLGTEVRYGMVVQLQHAMSEKYIRVSRQRTENRDGCKVSVDRNAGEAAWFRVVPSLRVHSEGEAIHLGDRIIFEHCISGLSLCVAVTAKSASGFATERQTLRREVYAGRSSAVTPLQVHVYRSWREQKEALGCLLSGQGVRLHHKEGEGTLYCSPMERVEGAEVPQAGAADKKADNAQVSIATDHDLKISSNTVWQLEGAERETGAPLRSSGGSALPWDGTFRILHASTGQALAIEESTSPLSPGAKTPGAGENPGEQQPYAAQLGVPVLINDAYERPDLTLFQREPQYDESDIELDAGKSSVDLGKYFFIRHAATGLYLHLEQDAAGDARLLATPKRYDFDVFGCQLVDPPYLRDLVYIVRQAAALRGYVGSFNGSKEKSDINFEAAQHVVSELIFFVTAETDNLDPLTRVGLSRPVQQIMMCEQHLLDLCMECVSVPFGSKSPFTHDDLIGSGKHKQLATLCKLSQRLFWNMLRDCNENREYASAYVLELQKLLGYSLGVAGTLTEIFTDNEKLLDSIDDETVGCFLALIHGEGGRQARYVDFLRTLCISRGKAVRCNQWRICRLLLVKAPELLIQLRLVDGKVIVQGDPHYFPAFKDAPTCELGEWVKKTHTDTLKYFERCIDLMALLCDGRNLRNTPTVRQQLPYELVMAIVRDRALPIEVRSKFVAVVRELYVDADPNEEEVQLRVLRKWNDVGMEAALAMPNATAIDLDHRFDDLKAFIKEYLSPFLNGTRGQCATHVETNHMIVNLLETLFFLIRGGFYDKGELRDLTRGLTKLLDGRNDKIGITPEKPEDRYRQRRTVKTAKTEAVDTLLIMEAKRWICQIFQLVCTERLDLRLSLLLNHYRGEFNASYGGVEGDEAQSKSRPKKGTGKQTSTKGGLQTVQITDPSTRISGRSETGDSGEDLRLSGVSDDGPVPRMDSFASTGQLMSADLGGISLEKAEEGASAQQPESGRLSIELKTGEYGFGFTMESAESGRSAVLVANLDSGCPNEGLIRRGDEIVTVGGVHVASDYYRTMEQLRKFKKDGKVTIEVIRDPDRMLALNGGGRQPKDKPKGKGAGRTRAASGSTTMVVASRSRKECQEKLNAVFNLMEDGDLVGILIDLTRYDSQTLGAQAIGLLVRQFEQRKVLMRAAREVQLLVTPRMVTSLGVLEGLMRRLNRLAARRRLYDHELYEATWLMSQLTMHCYDQESVENDGQSAIGSTRTKAILNVDHTKTTCLTLEGRATAVQGQKEVRFNEIGLGGQEGADAALVGWQRSYVWIFDVRYRVVAVDAEARMLTLDKAFQGESTEEAWVQLERKIADPDHDAQLLLSKLGTHSAALQLLQLPFDRERVRPEEVQVRSMICATYRLLKAMCNGFPLMQGTLSTHFSLYVGHTGVLKEFDISPTGFITAVCEGNRDACTRVEPEMVTSFTTLAGQLKQPQFLRFLRKIMGDNIVIKRNQNLVVSALVDHSEAIVLFNDPPGRGELANLIAERDMDRNPRGMLVYHIELVELLAAVAHAEDQEVKHLVRDLLPLHHLCDHLTQPPLDLDAPEHVLKVLLPLRSNHLHLLREAFLSASRRSLSKPLHALAGQDGLPRVIRELASVVNAFLAKRFDDGPSDFTEDEEAMRELGFVTENVLPIAANLFTCEHFTLRDEDMRSASEEFAHALVHYVEVTKENAFLPAKDCYKTLVAMSEHGLTVEEMLGEGASSLERMVSIDEGSDGRSLANLKAGQQGAKKSKSRHPQDTLLDFLEAYDDEINKADEFNDLTRTFLEESPGGINHKKDGGKKSHNPKDYPKMKCLVDKLLEGRVPEGETIDEDDLKQTLSALRVLDHILSMHDFQSTSKAAARFDYDRELLHRQDLLLALGVDRVCLMMAASQNAGLCEKGLELGNGLLNGGNKHVQASLYDLLNNPVHAEACRAYDGTGGSFLNKMRQQLRLATAEIREAKVYREQQEDRLALFEEEAAEGHLSDATKKAMRLELGKPFPSYSFVKNVLEMLRLMCEGHNDQMQDLLRKQATTTSSAHVDLVSEVYSYLMALEPELDGENIDEAIKAVESLTEFLQGNVSMKNAKLLCDTKLIDISGRIIMHRSLHGVQEEALNNLREAVGLMLMALLEGSDRMAERKMLLRLDLKGLARMVQFLYDDGQEVDGGQKDGENVALAIGRKGISAGIGAVKGFASQLGFDGAEDEALKSRRAAGFSLYILLRHLCDFEEQDASFAGLEFGGGQKRAREAMSDESIQEALEYYGRLVGSCEIVNPAGELERVFFQFPEVCLTLTEERKDALMWAVDRETPGAQLIDFIEAASDMYAEMVYESALKGFWLWRLASRHRHIANNSLFTLAIVINVVLLIRSQMCTSQDGAPRAWSSKFCSGSAQRAVNNFNETQSDVPSTNGYFGVVGEGPALEQNWALALQVVVFVLGVLMSIASVIVFILDALKAGPPRIRANVQSYVHKHSHQIPGLNLATNSFGEVMLRVREAPWLHAPWFLPLCIVSFFADGKLLFYTASFCAAVVGLTVNPFFFAFGLLDFAWKSPEIRIVASALFQNLRSIQMTIIFMVIMIYIFSVIGYWGFAESFFYMDFSEEAVPICTSLLQCFITVLDDGLRANDIGGAIEPLRTPDINELGIAGALTFYFRSLYSILFWFIVCIILLNVIFGIIIDSFGELRTHRQMIRGKMDNECFICGIDRFTLDTKGGGFDKHRDTEHHNWNYLFMLCMLIEKDPNDYNGWESHIAKHMSPANSSFMPRAQALSLQEATEREEAEVRRQAAQVERTARLVQDIAGSVEAIRARQEIMEKKLVQDKKRGEPGTPAPPSSSYRGESMQRLPVESVAAVAS